MLSYKTRNWCKYVSIWKVFCRFSYFYEYKHVTHPPKEDTHESTMKNTFCLLLAFSLALRLSAQTQTAFSHQANTILIAASNSLSEDKKAADLVCTGSHDEEVFQKAVDKLSKAEGLAKRSGNIVLLPGDYQIEGFQKENVDGKVAVLLPSLPSDPEVLSISFHGSNRNSECSVIHLTQDGFDALDDETSYSLFATEKLVDYCHFSFMDLKVTLPSGSKNIVCFDGRQMGSMECQRIKAVVLDRSTWETPTKDIKLPVEGCIAFCACFFNSNTWSNHWESCYALGFGQGYACGGEHLTLHKCVAAYGRYGFTFCNYYKDGTSSRHTNTLTDCIDEANANFWKFAPNTGKQTINVYNLNIEFWPQWFALEGQGHLATETVPGQYNGVINYTVNRGGYTLPNVYDRFWAEGSGINFKSANNTHKQVCTSSERQEYAPNLGQTLFDTTLNKQLICVDPYGKVWVDAMGQRQD